MADKSKLWYLENVNLFEALCPNTLENVADSSKMSTVKKDQFIYFPEDPSNTIFFLKEGKVKIGSFSDDGKEIIKAILNPGEVFGELAIVGEGKRDDFAQAIDTDVTICAMHMNDLEEIMSNNTSLSLKMTKLIGLRLRKTERRLRDLVFKDARTRIVDFIRDLADEIGTPVGDEILIKHAFTHEDIAKLTATSRQTVTTVLNELKDSDSIYLERKRILVRDIHQLA